MKAIVHERYGRPDVLELRELEPPVIGDEQVLVRVRASSINPSEWYSVTGMILARPSMGWRRPKNPQPAGEVAGLVEAVGKNVEGFQPGDEVFGTAAGAWAEYAVAREIRLARKPSNVSFEEAAVSPVAGLTALQAIRDHAGVQPGHKVLINGASGGVGTYAVQIAKEFGADVTAVCSTRNVEQARSLGADRVIDYTEEDFTKGGERHDVMLDIAGSRSFGELSRVLKPRATVVLVGGRLTYRRLGPVPHLVRTFVASIGRGQKTKFFVAQITKEDLTVMAELLETGKVKSVIDRRYELGDLPAALTYLGEGHARAKVVITV